MDKTKRGQYRDAIRLYQTLASSFDSQRAMVLFDRKITDLRYEKFLESNIYQ